MVWRARIGSWSSHSRVLMNVLPGWLGKCRGSKEWGGLHETEWRIQSLTLPQPHYEKKHSLTNSNLKNPIQNNGNLFSPLPPILFSSPIYLPPRHKLHNNKSRISARILSFHRHKTQKHMHPRQTWIQYGYGSCVFHNLVRVMVVMVVVRYLLICYVGYVCDSLGTRT